MKKKLPPFGKRLKNKIIAGEISHGINIYTSWDFVRSLPNAVTFPPDANPDDYDWTFLAGQEISLINTEGYADYEKLKYLAELLVVLGAKQVGLIDADYPLQWFIPEREAA